MYKQKMKNIIKKIALTIIYILLLTSFILGLIFIPKVYKLYKFSKEYINKPFSKEELQKNESRVLKIYDRNNILIGEYMPPSYEVVNVDDINPLLEQTLLLMEDQQFYSHHGINYLRSAYLGIKTIISRRIVGGGSTLTQQLAKLLFTKSEKTIERKLFEMFAAREIEDKYTKKEK